MVALIAMAGCASRAATTGAAPALGALGTPGALGSAPPAAPAAALPLAELAWLSGSWRSDDGGRFIEEVWTVPAGDAMFGINRTVRDGRTRAFEHLRIVARGDEVFYLASPGGRMPPTEFKLTERGERTVAFENPEHDFPTRIEYARAGDVLKAKVSGMMNGRESALEFEWVRAE